MATIPNKDSVPSNAPVNLRFNAEKMDEAINSQSTEYEDRLGKKRKTWAGIEKDSAEKIEETRQNLIPLSRQYMSLAAAQADIANIPAGSATYVRSSDGSSLADEYINQSGVLVATGIRMPSQKTIELMDGERKKLIDEINSDLLFLFSDSDGFYIADIGLDVNGKPVFRMGGMGLQRSPTGALEVMDSDGFTVSLDNISDRLREIESVGVVGAVNELTEGVFSKNGLILNRSPDRIFEIIDPDGFSVSLDEVINRIATLEQNPGGGSGASKESEVVSALEAEAQAAIASSMEWVSAPVATLRKGLNLFLIYGQSLAIGDEAFSVVTRSPSVLGNLMLGQAVRGANYFRTQDSTFGVIGGQNRYYPLEEKRQNGPDIITDPAISTNMGESVASGFMETLKTLHNRAKGVRNDEEVILACSSTGAVGTGLATLLKGAATPYYERLISALNGHMEAAAAAGYTDVQVCGLLFLQGEGDMAGVTRAGYLQMLNQLFDDFNTDAKRITGQSDDVGFYPYQTGGRYISTSQGNTLPITMAQLDITDRTDTFMAAPMFPYPQAVDTMNHKAANSYRWWGCAAANTVFRVLSNQNKSPFRMIKAVGIDNALYVSFMTPCPPLVSQPYYQVATAISRDDMGFTVIDGAGSLYGDSLDVEIISPCVIKITPGRLLTGNIRINLGDQFHGGGHNVADSSPQQSVFKWQYYGDNNQKATENIPSLNNMPYALYNYAAIQTINVVKG